MFLVTFGSMLDDVPLRLFCTKSAAVAYAESVAAMYDADEEGGAHVYVKEAHDLCKRDLCEFICCSIWEFDSNGKVIAHWVR